MCVAIVVGERVRIGRGCAGTRDDGQSRMSTIDESLRSRRCLWTESFDDAIEFANATPRHVLVVAANADLVLGRLRNQGTVFFGETTSNAFGDYMTGANHVLPTGGMARSYPDCQARLFRWTNTSV